MNVVRRDLQGAFPDTPARVVDSSKLDLAAAEKAALDLLRALGADLDYPGLLETPRRVAASFVELLTPAEFDATLFRNEGYDELVLVRDIPFQSLCMHHLLPFHGVAHVAYLPGECIIGISKLARVVEAFSRDLQLQERMTVQIADWLEQELSPGRGRGAPCRAHVYDDPGRTQAGREDHHVGGARPAAGRRAHAPGVLQPCRRKPVSGRR